MKMPGKDFLRHFRFPFMFKGQHNMPPNTGNAQNSAVLVAFGLCFLYFFA